MSGLKPDRWFEIPKVVLDHKVQSVLLKLLKLNKFQAFTIAAGRRSFKTERFAKRYMVSKAVSNPNKLYHLTAPTRIQAKDIFWKDIKGLVPNYLKKKVSETELTIELINNTTLSVIGLKEFQRKEGTMSHGAVFSEFQQVDVEAYNQTFEPMLNDTGGIPIFEGRPFGKNHFFDFYKRGFDVGDYIYNNPTKDVDELIAGIIKMPYDWVSFHWKSDEVLSTEQIERAKSNLSKKDYEREYEASFETEFGSPYHAFSQTNLYKQEYVNYLPVIVTCDFNATVNPMSWVVGQTINRNNLDNTYWQKCLSYQYTNTETMCGILDDYFKTIDYPKKINFYGDYAGNQQKSNSNKSDWQIIEDYFRNKTEMTFNLKPCLSIVDSIASTNARLRNTVNECRQFVDPDNCTSLILDWEKCEWADNSKEIKSKDPMRGHTCRAVDYYNYFEYPLERQPTYDIRFA